MSFAAAEGWGLGGEHPLLLLLAGLALFAAVIALTREHERPFSSASVYLLVGGLISLGLRLAGLEVFNPLTDPVVLERLTEVGVIIALFAAGLRLDRTLTWSGWRTPAVLLGVVMPATIGLVTLWGSLVMGLSLGAAVLLGAVLAPTDPVLAKDVSVGPPGEHDEPEPKFALTAEAGLNDGLAFPFVFLGLFIAGEQTGWFVEWFSADVLYAILMGLAAGALGGRLIAAVVVRLRGTEWLTTDLDGWIAVGATLIVYGATELVGAYGFLAAFAAGLAFRRSHAEQDLSTGAHHGIETAENVAELALVLLIGTTVTITGLGQPGLWGWLLVPMLLVVIRPLLTIAALAPLRLPLRERAFIGWFGIRGIGSLYYVAVALGAGVLSMDEATTLYWTVIACVGVSILVHGITASPVTREVVEEIDQQAG